MTTTATGAVDSVVDDRTGLVVPVDDPVALAAALRRLCLDPALRRRLGVEARQRAVRDFTQTRIWAGLVGIYRPERPAAPAPAPTPAPVGLQPRSDSSQTSDIINYSK